MCSKSRQYFAKKRNSKLKKNELLFECFNSQKQFFFEIYLFPPPSFQLSHFAPKMTNQPQENLVKSGYKTNRKAKNLGIPITCW
jgi:hypothetical protein